MEYNPHSRDVGFMANFFAVKESDRAPAIVLGTSADRLGTGGSHGDYAPPDSGGGGGDHGHLAAESGRSHLTLHSGPENPRAFYVTASKQIGRLPIAPYVSVNYSETDRGINFPFGAVIQLRKNLTLLPMYDGQRAHTQLTWTRGQQTIGIIAAWNRRLGISFGYGF